MDEDLTEIQVRFVTKLDASVPDTTFSLPVRLQRYGLSGVVNHLLAQGSTLHLLSHSGTVAVEQKHMK